MENFENEFKSISQIYCEVSNVISRFAEMDASQSSCLAKSILENRDCFDRIDRMHSRVIQLSSRWKKDRNKTDAKRWEEIDRLADDALKQAVRLNQLCSITVNRLQAAKDEIGTELTEVGKGARFLKSAAPAQNNYPKFIDSMG